MSKHRRPPYTADEAQKIFEARALEPEKSTKEFCKAFGITEPQYYALKTRFGKDAKPKAEKPAKAAKPGRKPGRPAGSKSKVITHDAAELIVAMKEARRWKLEVARLSKGITADQLLDALSLMMEGA